MEGMVPGEIFVWVALLSVCFLLWYGGVIPFYKASLNWAIYPWTLLTLGGGLTGGIWGLAIGSEWMSDDAIDLMILVAIAIDFIVVFLIAGIVITRIESKRNKIRAILVCSLLVVGMGAAALSAYCYRWGC